MISKGRLKELIEQGATIYAIVKIPFIAGYSQILEVEEFDLKAPIIKEISEDGKQFLYFNHLLDLDYLFETKEDAEFALKFKRIPRTEYLDLPTWDEIEDCYDLEFSNSGFEVYKMKNRILVKTNKDYYLDLYDYIFDKPATKENYLFACELARKLWLGEEV